MKKITVYSTPTCVYCAQLKNYLQENKIEFEAIDLSQNMEEGQKLIAKTGQMGVPQTSIQEIDKNGEVKKEDFVIGFNVEQINSLLGIS